MPQILLFLFTWPQNHNFSPPIFPNTTGAKKRHFSRVGAEIRWLGAKRIWLICMLLLLQIRKLACVSKFPEMHFRHFLRPFCAPNPLTECCEACEFMLHIIAKCSIKNYNKLWELLVAKVMKKKDLQAAASVRAGVITKRGKDENVTTSKPELCSQR